MTHESGEKREGVAYVVSRGSYADLEINGHVIRDSINRMWADELAGKINRALSPLLRRAEMAERMAEAVKKGHIYQGYCPDNVKGQASRDPECELCQALTAWDAIKGDGE